MTDKELLELAAKAAGHHIVDNGHPISLYIASEGCKGGVRWNPLSDDGDALRLAAKLCIEIEHNNPLDIDRYVRAYRCGILSVRDPISITEEFEDEDQRVAAMCRVITRAAAESEKKQRNSETREATLPPLKLRGDLV